MSEAKIVPVWASVGKNNIRRKVFVPLTRGLKTDVGVDEAAHGCVAELYNQGVVGEDEFPVLVMVFESSEGAEPLGQKLVDMEIRPVFTVYETIAVK